MSASPKKRKGRKKPGDAIDLSDTQKLKKAALKIEALERELVNRSEIAARAVAEKNNLQDILREKERDLEQEKEDRADILAAMAHQYKATQEHLLAEITKLSTQIQNMEDDNIIMTQHYEELLKEKDRQIEERDVKIDQQQQSMEDMAGNFHEMLNDTLKRIGLKIERAQGAYANQAALPSKRNF